MRKVEPLLKSNLNDITYPDLICLQQEYHELLHQHPFPQPEQWDPISVIRHLKRKDETQDCIIGPYKFITLFEAANRIASDLVIIQGVRQLIDEGKEPENSKITLCLGTTHVQNKGDFTINGFEGEAFNVAPSFYKAKLAKTLSKWKKEKHPLKYILVNAEAVIESDIERLAPNISLIKVMNWDNLLTKEERQIIQEAEATLQA